jgi:hypothetical protein
MNAHFATRSLNPDGSWKNLAEMFNTSADVSPTGSQMPRLVGLAHASRLYRELEELKSLTQFSDNGNEIAFGTIGNASCAEGLFWESLNAIGVLQAPALISIWDDEYGISVNYQRQSFGIAQRISTISQGRPVSQGLRILQRQRLGLRESGKNISKGRRACPQGTCAGNRSRDRNYTAPGPLHLGQSRTVQIENAARVGAGI